MKAYKDEHGKVRLFRPEMNMARMNRSTARIALPVSLNPFYAHGTFFFINVNNRVSMVKN